MYSFCRQLHNSIVIILTPRCLKFIYKSCAILDNWKVWAQIKNLISLSAIVLSQAAFAHEFCANIPCTLKEIQLAHKTQLNEDTSHLRYRLHKGDTISEVLHRLHIKKIWGVGNKVEQTAELNQGIVFNDGNSVSYLAIILLPVTELPISPDYLVNNSTREVTFTAQTLVETIPEKTIEPVEVTEPIKTIDPIPIATPAAVASVAPASVTSSLHEEATTDDGFVPFDVMRISFDPNFTRIDGKDSNTNGVAVLGSNINYDFGISYRQVFSRKFSAGVGLDLNFVKYTDTTTRPILGEQSMYINFRVDAGFAIAPNVMLLTRFSYAQRPFIRGINNSALQLDTVATLGFGTGLSWLVADSPKFRFYVEGGPGFLFPSSTSNYTIKAGYFYFGTFRLARDLTQNTGLEISPYFRFDLQDTNILIDSTSEIGLKFNYVIKF